MRTRSRSRAFSLIELVIVVVIIAIIGAIAIPRVSSAASHAKDAALLGNWRVLQSGADMFTAEHTGMSIGLTPAGAALDAATLTKRFIGYSDSLGLPNPAGLFGPYIRSIPDNPFNDLDTIRIDGVAVGANTHGWRLDTPTGRIDPDHAGAPATYNGVKTVDGKLAVI